MPTTIVCFYIECADQVVLEAALSQAGYAFLDATDSDFYTKPQTPCGHCGKSPPRIWNDLEDIECAIRGK